MADEGSSINPSSMSIRKAINKNQTFDKELKKELHYLDLKKKSSEKAFEYRKNQFIRKRLCLNHLGKSESSSRDASLIRQRRLGTFGEFQDFSSRSTGNLLESIIQTRGSQSSVEKGEQIIKKKFHKLSLDCSNLYRNNDKIKGLVRLTSGKRIEKSHSWSEDLSTKDSNEDIEVQQEIVPSTSLQLPSLPKFFRSQSAETLHKTSEANNMGEVSKADQQNNSTKRLSHLRAPVLDKRRSRSAEHLAMPSIGARASSRSPSPQPEALERQHSFSEEKRPSHSQTEKTKPSTRLVLPPLTRPRSKSVEIHDKHVVRRVRANSDIEPPNFDRQTKPTSRPRNGKAKAPQKASSFGETGKKKRNENDKNENRSNIGKPLRRSSSTPDLLDLGSEVEYLLMDDDQTRLQRMRAAVRALSFVANIKECRYIRNGNAFHQNEDDEQAQGAQASSNVPFPVITPNSTTPTHCNKEGTNQEDECNFLEESQNEPMVTTSGDSTDLSRDSDEPIGHLDGSLGSSNASTLAEMFEEIKKTRYLRMPGRTVDDDDDDDVDVLMTSHGYNTPMIIVGYTKSVLMEDNTL